MWFFWRKAVGRERAFNGRYAAPHSFHFASAYRKILYLFQPRKTTKTWYFSPNKIQPFKYYHIFIIFRGKKVVKFNKNTRLQIPAAPIYIRSNVCRKTQKLINIILFPLRHWNLGVFGIGIPKSGNASFFLVVIHFLMFSNAFMGLFFF